MALTRIDAQNVVDTLPAGLHGVEDIYLPRGVISLRLPMVFGERDYQRREEFMLRRVRAGRDCIPIGARHG